MLIYIFSLLLGIGVFLFLLLSLYKMFHVGINKNVSGSNERIERARRYIIILEIVIAIIMTIYVCNTPNLPIIEGTSIGAVNSFGNNRFYLSYRTSGRRYSDNVEMDEAALQNVYVKCTCGQGKVYVKFSQDVAEEVIDVTNYDGNIEMDKFSAGNIKISTYNENAKDVKLEITWK